MCSIDDWLEYQDYLKNKQALPQPHISDMDNEHHPPTVDDEQPLELQPKVHQCQNATTEHVPQLGGQLQG